MIEILYMKQAALLALPPELVTRPLSTEEVVHIAKELGAYWAYDYQALEQGRPGMHALLKSGRHSDGFFVSRIMLEHDDILKIMARQLAMKFLDEGIFEIPDYVAGIPDGATHLGEELAKILGVRALELKKKEGKIFLAQILGDNVRILLCEDFCTRGTGFREAVLDIKYRYPSVKFILNEPVIINRGGLSFVEVEGVGKFTILPIADHRVNDWEPEECPLCKAGSGTIKPKAKPENWGIITNSQL
jgi:orotate phosphoribosyltransferase